jgi:hypothetical protein
MYLHISPWGSKSTLPSTTLQLCSIRHIPWTCYHLNFSCFHYQIKCPERIMINKRWQSQYKTMRALTEVLKNDFQECFQKLYNHWQKFITAHWKYSEGNVV